jgi:hypothetical protein
MHTSLEGAALHAFHKAKTMVIDGADQFDPYREGSNRMDTSRGGAPRRHLFDTSVGTIEADAPMASTEVWS